MYTTVRYYEDGAQDVVEQIRGHEERLRELMRGIEGFVAYYLVDTGRRSLVTVSVFADRSGAEESTRAAAKLIGELGLGHVLPNPPKIMQGEVAVHI
ncbi:hypothetical protein [Actinomycetospora lemnae]|uniref:ABM domain-containing protein n=1 Tax=Actinomycetospora lemnae TaxID=3019891 RepID=A0ABT5SZE6_9PSEU|nr:hypothetical protein [Actinomycetospora sp. DW7H6]MDD7968235.1 hypothetical protein [Actinomycetospora sp. DW7H6]